MDVSARDRVLSRWELLKRERSSWMGQWNDISRYMQPRAGRFLNSTGATGNENKGERRDGSILDNTATNALKTLGSGLHAGMSSPSTPWFRLATSDAKLDEAASVKAWLHETEELMRMVLAKSNTYRSLHGCYEELGAFGTCATVITEDFSNVVNHHPLTVGEYAVATDHQRRVNTLYREFQMTAEQCVGQFGYANCSQSTRNLYDSRLYDQWVPVVHAIEPRHERDVTSRASKNMPWRSIYLEPGGNGVLRESGFKEFPALVARWTTYGGDVYGSSPAMQALGDTKQLQQQQKRKSQAIDYMTMPPLQAPAMLKNQQSNLLPGGLTFVDAVGAQQAVRSMFDVNLNLQHLLLDIQDVRQRIDRAFHVDLFRMLDAMNGRDPRMTATEVMARQQEKMLMLGPVLERLHGEMLSPLVETTFAYMVEANIVPPAPPELQGRQLNVEFISALAQAQRSAAVGAVDRFVMSLGQIASVKPDVLDKFDSDHWADFYSDRLGVPPQMVVAGEQVALIRQQRAQQQAAMVQAQMAEQAAGAAAKLGSVKTNEPNALTDVAQAVAQ